MVLTFEYSDARHAAGGRVDCEVLLLSTLHVKEVESLHFLLSDSYLLELAVGMENISSFSPEHRNSSQVVGAGDLWPLAYSDVATSLRRRCDATLRAVPVSMKES